MQEIEFHCLMCIRNHGNLIDSAGGSNAYRILVNVELVWGVYAL